MAGSGEQNIGLALKLFEKDKKEPQRSSRSEFYIEILEAVILSLVAVSTAWCGYQAEQWGGQQALHIMVRLIY